MLFGGARSQATSPPPPLEIAVVYFRAGYTPTPAHCATRALLDRSLATRRTTLALQLAGGKKVQQVLARQGCSSASCTLIRRRRRRVRQLDGRAENARLRSPRFSRASQQGGRGERAGDLCVGALREGERRCSWLLGLGIGVSRGLKAK